MIKLVLKVDSINRISNSKGSKLFSYTCKDKFGLEYIFVSKCYKLADSYILVSIQKYDTSVLKNFEQIQLKVSYIKELQVINGRLNAKSDILKEVKDYITNTDVKYLNKRLKGVKDSLDYSCEDIGQLRDYEQEQIEIKRQLQRYNMLVA